MISVIGSGTGFILLSGGNGRCFALRLSADDDSLHASAMLSIAASENRRPKACMTARSLDINVRVNGEAISANVEARKTLVDFLRDDLCLTGTHIGCEHGVCGACTVRLDGAVVRGCLVLAVQCDGGEVETIEGLSDTGMLADLQLAFQQRNALQCGYCTPGMLIGAQELLSRGGIPSRDTIREHLSGNYCRCTGYQAIVDAIESVAQARAKKAS
jgi:carbon-monoxide dehydrogenase small subunit